MQKGLSLLELMCALAIFAILTSIAYPNYLDQIQKARRSDAEGALLGLASSMERYYTENNSYLKAAGTDAAQKDTGSPRYFPSQSPIDADVKFYNLTISAATESSYTLTATPIGAQTNDACGTLTLSNTGVRSAKKNGCW